MRNHYIKPSVSKALLLAALAIIPDAFLTTECMAQDKPVIKVDLSMQRPNDDEVLEPGYTNWVVTRTVTHAITINGVTFQLEAKNNNPETVLRSVYNKTQIQNADNKAKNGRLTFDGAHIDPRDYGSITLTIKDLPVGNHTLRTYHNSWEDPGKFQYAPLNAKLNGTLVYEKQQFTAWQNVAANATIFTFNFTIENAGDVATIEIYTQESDPTFNYGSTANLYNAPFCNGFELNTADITLAAKDPYPATGDMHADADAGEVTLKWSPASSDVKQHLLYIGTDSTTVAQMTTPIATLAASETTYLLKDTYSLTTYYWRVDEVDAAGTVNAGQVWYFKPRQLAFPGAEGYGRYANGGRGGVVYHVTNLSNERIPGSFTYGLLDVKGPKTIVFDVSGIIDLRFKAIFTLPNTTIAGQTAPGKGICIKGSNINIGTDNICRHMRFKHGYGDTGNAMGLSGANHAIVDHTTAAWGTDETVSGRGAKNISFQYSMIAEALGIADHKNYPTGTNHGYAATIDGKIGSWHHNLLVNCAGRNWSMGGGMDGEARAIGQMDLFNNVVYNWHKRTTDGNCHEVNFVGNYYKMGPDTRHTILFTQNYENIGHPESTWRAYIKGNIRENKNGTLTHDKKDETYEVHLSNGDPGPDYESVVDAPFFPSYAKIHSAQNAFKIVTSESGATMPVRDDQHVRVVKETVDGTYTYVGSRSGIKGEIDHEDDAGGWETYPEETRAADFDTDQDGMPNWYEKLVGSDANVANNNDDPNHDGWTLLEDYLEFMAHPYLIIEPDAKAEFNAAPWFVGFTKSPSYSVTTDSNLFTATVSGSTISVQAGKAGGIGVITMKVTDSEGSTHEKRLSIAVTGEPTGIQAPWTEAGMDIVKREFFTLDGKQVSTMKQHEVYIMKLTEANGQTHAVKVIKN